MKRSKIKRKYLNVINIDKDIDKIKTKNNVLINILKSIGLILLLLCWSYIPIIIMYFLGINYSNFSLKNRVLYLFGCDILFLLFLIFIYRKDMVNNFKNYFNSKILYNLGLSIRYWLYGLGVMVISNFIINMFINPGGIANNEESVRQLINVSPWFMAFELALYAPITEEIIFRKSIRDIISSKYFYIITSGVVFGAMHVVGSIGSAIDVLYLIPYASLGIALASLYYKTNNIFSTISIHALHNTMALVLYLVGNVI